MTDESTGKFILAMTAVAFFAFLAFLLYQLQQQQAAASAAGYSLSAGSIVSVLDSTGAPTFTIVEKPLAGGGQFSFVQTPRPSA
jgi:hypothetical protein